MTHSVRKTTTKMELPFHHQYTQNRVAFLSAADILRYFPSFHPPHFRKARIRSENRAVFDISPAAVFHISVTEPKSCHKLLEAHSLHRLHSVLLNPV